MTFSHLVLELLTSYKQNIHTHILHLYPEIAVELLWNFLSEPLHVLKSDLNTCVDCIHGYYQAKHIFKKKYHHLYPQQFVFLFNRLLDWDIDRLLESLQKLKLRPEDAQNFMCLREILAYPGTLVFLYKFIRYT